jgi:hypothetical protein
MLGHASDHDRVRPHPWREVTGPADVLTTDGGWERVPDGAIVPVLDGNAVVRPWSGGGRPLPAAP